MYRAEHAQAGFDRRFEWGLAGARLLAPQVDALVVVDLLSFSTSTDTVSYTI
jgi:2-phosphosulfolactate phosphatase